jgi:Mrp family chromosome partitioning ATPase
MRELNATGSEWKKRMADGSVGQKEVEAGAPPGVAHPISAHPDQATLRRVMDKSIAVTSGKGGVGKTITACNLAIYYARKGLNVGLVDIDPLSDVASLLDLQAPEQAVTGETAGRMGPADGLQAFLLPVFRGLAVLFPYQKLGSAEVSGVMEKIYGPYLAEIDSRFNVLLFDMPAGMHYEDNLVYLPYMKRIILVTNPEPTAHASAGAYAKEVQRLFPGTPIRFWHNRYSVRPQQGFNPRDVAGNYNRFVSESERLTPAEIPFLRDFAFVPEDPALDLLQGEPNPVVHVLKCMRDSLDYAHGRLLFQASRRLGIPPRMQDIVTTYIHRNTQIEETDEYLARLGEYLNSVLQSVLPEGSPPASQMFTPEERSALDGFLRRVKASAMRGEILRVQDLLAEQIRRMEEARGAFASRPQPGHDKQMDREIARFLMTLGKAARHSAMVRNQGVLLLFYFSLHKLFQSRTLVGVLKQLIPRRINSRGRKVRDRFRQIQILVERDPDYRAQYLKTMRTLHLIVSRQISAVAKTFELDVLLLKDGDSRLDSRAYLKLLAAFLHETLYSGLSVIVGFDYRSAALAFQDGAERLLASIGEAE